MTIETVGNCTTVKYGGGSMQASVKLKTSPVHITDLSGDIWIVLKSKHTNLVKI